MLQSLQQVRRNSNLIIEFCGVFHCFTHQIEKPVVGEGKGRETHLRRRRRTMGAGTEGVSICAAQLGKGFAAAGFEAHSGREGRSCGGAAREGGARVGATGGNE
ncbi:hypothetical protein HKD37_10G027289 [Glycine soja]